MKPLLIALMLIMTGCSQPKLGGYIEGALLKSINDHNPDMAIDTVTDIYGEVESGIYYRFNHNLRIQGKIQHQSSVETSMDKGHNFAGAGLRLDF